MVIIMLEMLITSNVNCIKIRLSSRQLGTFSQPWHLHLSCHLPHIQSHHASTIYSIFSVIMALSHLCSYKGLPTLLQSFPLFNPSSTVEKMTSKIQIGSCHNPCLSFRESLQIWEQISNSLNMAHKVLHDLIPAYFSRSIFHYYTFHV